MSANEDGVCAVDVVIVLSVSFACENEQEQYRGTSYPRVIELL